MGKGKVFLGKKEYRELIQKKIGFIPFPGTLNLEISADDVQTLQKKGKKHTIESFQNEKQSFGGMDWYAGKLPDGSACAIIIPHQTTHPKGILEVIAPFSIREKFGLKNDSALTIQLDE